MGPVIAGGHWLRSACQICGLLLIWLLCTGHVAASARPPSYTVTKWTADDGLPHNLVHAVAQENDGLIWVATWEGAARFNGRVFTSYERQSIPGLEVDGVYLVQRDADGGMLFGTAYDGVYRFRDGNWEHLGDARARRLRVSALLRDYDAGLWVGTPSNLFRIERDGRLVEAGAASGLPDVRVSALLHDEDGGLLVGNEQGIFRIAADGKARRWNPARDLGNTPVRQLGRDREGGVLAATNDGIWWWRRGGRLERHRPGVQVDAVLQDRRGQLWMNLNSGELVVHRGAGLEDLTIPLTGRVSAGLMEDQEGLIWVGTSQGLSRIAEGAVRAITAADGLDSDYVRVVLQTDDGVIWIGHAAGLARWQDGKLSQLRLFPQARQSLDPSVLALAADAADGVWVGTYNAGVLRVGADGRVVTRIAATHATPSPIRALLPDLDGGVWIGGDAGLAHWRDGRMGSYGVVDGLPPQSVQVLYRDSHGTMWIGGNQGMASLDGSGRLRNWHAMDDFPAQNVFDFLGDADGGLWIASDRGLLHLRNGRFQVYDHRHGFPRDKLFRILDDGAGFLWLSSNHGVFRIARADFDAVDAGRRKQLGVEVVDRSDGMPSNQNNGSSSPAGWRAHSGELLFPTAQGLGIIDTTGGQQLQRNTPRVLLERIVVDGVVRQPQSSFRVQGGIRRLLIDYTGLSFRAPDKLRYRYRLQGFDTDWIEAGGGTEAVYTNLPPGRYRFELQAMSMPVDWRRAGAVGSVEMVLELVPPWWHRAEFLVVAAMAMVGAVYLLFLWRTARYRRQQRRMSALISARTHELSEMNRALLEADRQREDLLRKLEYQADHDVLTGLPNRRAAERNLDKMIDDAFSQGVALAVALVDIDYFKRINDSYGHDVGDTMLRRVATVLSREASDGVFAARLGGEEFLLMVTEMSEDQARTLFECIRRKIGAIRLDAMHAPVGCSVSMGMQMYESSMSGRRELLARADRRLYLAKHGGRDQLVGSDAD
jgi:diguanylate cyclase (GGDEF)-like protein